MLISGSGSCGCCEYCPKGMSTHCKTGVWLLGHRIDYTQAEFMRIPYADTSLYPAPEGADEEALVMMSDILPTSVECDVLTVQFYGQAEIFVCAVYF